LGWPVLAAEEMSPKALESAFKLALTSAARARARLCASSAVKELGAVRESFLAELAG